MGPKFLVETYVAMGRSLLEELDKAGISVPAAIWLYSSDSEEWALVLAPEEYEKYGPAHFYGLLQDLLARMNPPSSISFLNISLVSPRNSLIRALASAIPTGTGIADIRFRKHIFDGILVDDAVVYRMLPLATTAIGSQQPSQAS